MTDPGDPEGGAEGPRTLLLVACVGTALLVAGLLAATKVAPSLPLALWETALSGLVAGAVVLFAAPRS